MATLLEKMQAAGIKPQGNTGQQTSLVQKMQAAGIKPMSTVKNDSSGSFLGNAIKAIAEPIARVDTSFYNIADALLNGSDARKPRNLPFFGETKPVQLPVISPNVGESRLATPQETIKGVKDTIGTGLQVGTTLAPVGVAGSLASKSLQLGATGGGYELGRQLVSNEPLDVSSIAGNAAVSAALPIGAELLSIVFNKLPESAWKTVLKRSPTEVAKNPNLAKQAAQEGITGATRSSIIKQAENTIQGIEMSLDDLLSPIKQKVIKADNIASYLDNLKTSYQAIPGEENAVSIIQNLQDAVVKKGDLTPVEANQLKREIYNVVKKSYGKGTMEIPAKTEGQKIVASALKQEIEKVIPEIKDLNARQAVYIQVKKAIEKSLQRVEGKGVAGSGVGLYDLLLGSGGMAAAGPIGAAKTIAIKKIAESPLVMTNVANATTKMMRFFNNLSPTKKVLFYQALLGLTKYKDNSIRVKPMSNTPNK